MHESLAAALGVSSPEDFKQFAELDWVAPACLQWSAVTRCLFRLYAAQETLRGAPAGVFGRLLQTGVCAGLSIQVEGTFRTIVTVDKERSRLRVRVRRAAGRTDTGIRARVGVRTLSPETDDVTHLVGALLDPWEGNRSTPEAFSSMAAFSALLEKMSNRLQSRLCPVRSELDLAGIRERMSVVSRLAQLILEKAGLGIEKKYAAGLAACYNRALGGNPDSLVSGAGTRAQERPSKAAIAPNLPLDLLDCSFAFTPEGLALYRRALTGDYDAVLHPEKPASPDGEANGGVFASIALETTVLELHLPLFTRRRPLGTILEDFSAVGVRVTEDARLLVSRSDLDAGQAANAHCSDMLMAAYLITGAGVHESGSHIGFSDERSMPARRASRDLEPLLSAYRIDPAARTWLREIAAASPDRQIMASFSIRTPGEMLAAWLDLPPERSLDFKHRMIRVSGAVQRALRLWLPYIYFHKIEHLEDVPLARGMLVYQATRPNRSEGRDHYTYDPIDPDSLEVAYAHARKRLPPALRRAKETLMEAGNQETGIFFSPLRADEIVQDARRHPNQLRALLAADAYIVDLLLGMANSAGQLLRALDDGQRNAPRDLCRFSAMVKQAIERKLERLYKGETFVPLYSLILIEATRALYEANQIRTKKSINAPYTPVEALLRLRPAGAEHPQVFTNSEYRG